jgi:hypothetical protein
VGVVRGHACHDYLCTERLNFDRKRFGRFSSKTPSGLAQASACDFFMTSVRWSQTDRFAKTVANRSRRQQQAFWAKIAQNVFHILRLSVVSSLASRWLATSGRWSSLRHKRTLAPFTWRFEQNLPKTPLPFYIPNSIHSFSHSITLPLATTR